jgi:hypothetical protein
MLDALAGRHLKPPWIGGGTVRRGVPGPLRSKTAAKRAIERRPIAGAELIGKVRYPLASPLELGYLTFGFFASNSIRS